MKGAAARDIVERQLVNATTPCMLAGKEHSLIQGISDA